MSLNIEAQVNLLIFFQIWKKKEKVNFVRTLLKHSSSDRYKNDFFLQFLNQILNLSFNP